VERKENCSSGYQGVAATQGGKAEPMNSGDNGNKPLPYSEDDEKGVLCSRILSPVETGNLCDQLNLKPEHFYAPAHQIVYGKLLEWKGDGAVELAWLKREIKKRDQLKEVGGPEFLHSLRSFVPTGSNVDYYIKGVLDSWRRRSAILEYRRRENAAFDEHEPVESFDPEGIFGPAENGALPPFESLVDLSAVELPEPEILIAGLLHVGSS
jgi:replicative DNA helicase